MIRVRGLRKDYPGGPRALDGIDLHVARGEFVALIGSSGAGKSTLLRCLNGLVTPTAGQVEVDGVAVTGAAAEALRLVRSRVGFVFQQFNLLRRLTVLDNAMLGRLPHLPRWRSLLGWFAAAELERTRATLARVGLADLAGRRVDTLSGGQQQRVAIARALVGSPELLLADEPTGNLDSASARQIMDLLARINREDGMTIIMVTHDHELAARAHRKLHILDGRIIDPRAPAEREALL